MFSHAIVKKPGKSYVNGLTTSDLGRPNFQLALEQHTQYIKALKQCGVKLIELDADEQFPDSTFVEDTAILTETCAIVTNPGAASRNGEIQNMKDVLTRYYETHYVIQAPGTLDGGDVLQVNNHFYIGLSDRTNIAGATQLKEILEQHGYEVTIVTLRDVFHLKTGISYLGDNTLVVAGEFIQHPLFKDFNHIIVEEKEAYAANCIRVNDDVIIPSGFEKTAQQIIDAGYSVIEVDMSEFQKQDGGLSCLSLRF